MSDGATEKRLLGRYELLYLLGQGGMGEVHLARLTGVAGFEKLCILKTILPSVRADPQFVDRFHHEAKVLVQLNHSNIAQVYDMGEADGTLFMAIEYIPGVDLSRVEDRVRGLESEVPVPVALYLGQQMLEALGYAHRKPGGDGKSLGIVHRDVSPQNVMVSYEGEVKVIDFGLAKSAARTKATLPSTVLGKLGYMAPEQALARPVDHRGDIYSAGIVIWELLAGRPLIEGGTVAEMMARMANPSIPSIRALRPEVSLEVERAVLRALETDPAARWTRADDFARALNEQAVKEGLTIGAEDVGNYVRTMCPEEYAAERKLLSRLSSAAKKKSVVSAQPALPGTLMRPSSSADASVAALGAAVGATLMRPGGSGDAPPMTPAQRALSQLAEPSGPRPAAAPPPAQEPLPPSAPPKRGLVLGLVVALVVLAGGGGAAMLLLGRDPVEPPPVPRPVEPPRPSEPLKVVEPELPAQPEADAGQAEQPAGPAGPVALGRVEVKKAFGVVKDRGDYWVKFEKKKPSIGETYKLIGAPLAGSKKEREWFAEGTVMEVKGSLARLSLEPGDAVMPPGVQAVPAAKEANLKKRLGKEPAEARVAPVKPAADADADAGSGAVAEKPAEPEQPAEPVKPAEPAKVRKTLKGTLEERTFGVRLTNKDDFKWTACKVWRPPNLKYAFPESWVLEPGQDDSVRNGAFEEDPAPPKGWNTGYYLLSCIEGAAHLSPAK